MAVQYLNSGRAVWKNHILNPDFADLTNWRPLNASSTISVVNDARFPGGKALKITGSSGGVYGATYDGPGILGADVGNASGDMVWVVSRWADTAGFTAYLGASLEDASRNVTGGGSKYGGSSLTPYRDSMQVGSYVGWGVMNPTRYVRPQVRFEGSGAFVGYIASAMIVAEYFDSYGGGLAWPNHISGNVTDGTDGLNYDWSGTANASISTAVATAWVDIPTTGVEGQSFTVTGAGFAASQRLRVWVFPEVADNTFWETTASADGTFNYTFTMPKHTGGTGTKVRVSGLAAGGGQPYAEQAVTIPVVPPMTAPATTADQVVNYFLDPRLKTTDGTTVLAKNYFPNPSPKTSLSGYATTGTASIALDATSSIKGAGGVRVNSSDASSGIAFTIGSNSFVPNDPDPTFTVYVRAREAMTITGGYSSATYANNTAWGPDSRMGWGDFGWGEPYTYVEGASHTFAAGEVKRFRVMPRLADYVNNTDPALTFTLKGSGVFDVDAVWVGAGVDDGVDPDGFPGGVYAIPDAPLWFSGDTADTADFIYDWEGAPNASASVKRGHQPKYFRAAANNMQAGMETVFTTTLPTGETAVGHQSSWDESGGDFAYPTYDGRADGVGEDLRGLGLTPGKSYALSFDLISMMENYVEGYIGGSPWAQIYLEVGDSYLGISAEHPYRNRFTFPFTVGTDSIEAQLTCYRDWYTGYHAYANFAINEIDFHARYTGAVWGTPGEADLLALGAVAGKSYRILMDEAPGSAGDYRRVEYQAGGAWTTLAEVLYDPNFSGEGTDFSFTIPAGATACRLSWSGGQPYFDVYTAPVPFFDGDTPDGDGFTYSWSGTPHESASIRTVGSSGPSITAQVFVGGAAVPVTEARAVVGGVLVPVSQIGI